jgi:hypothetical protein
MKSAIATSIRAPAFGSIAFPQSFIWVTGPLLGFFLGLKNELGECLGVLVLPLRLELCSVTVQGRFNEGIAGNFSFLSPAPVEPEGYDLGDNAYHERR